MRHFGRPQELGRSVDVYGMGFLPMALARRFVYFLRPGSLKHYFVFLVLGYILGNRRRYRVCFRCLSTFRTFPEFGVQTLQVSMRSSGFQFYWCRRKLYCRFDYNLAFGSTGHGNWSLGVFIVFFFVLVITIIRFVLFGSHLRALYTLK
jgi:hypothetical protein